MAWRQRRGHGTDPRPDRPSRRGAGHGRDHAADLGPDHSAEHRVTLVSRSGCHLCEDAERVLRELAAELGFDLTELDVDDDPALRAEYADRVPVVLLDGREHGYWRVEVERLRAALRRPVRPAGG